MAQLWAEYFRRYNGRYLVIALCLILFVYAEFVLEPRWDTVRFDVGDASISKSYVEDELVSDVGCVLLAGGLSCVLLIWYCLFGTQVSTRKMALHDDLTHDTARPRFIPKSWHLLHMSLLCLLLILCLNGACTCCLKLVVGNLRPDFIARCQPVVTNHNKNELPPLLTIESCRQSDTRRLYEGLKSTPSGHSSFMAAGMTYLTLWQCYFVTGTKWKHLWCPVLALIVMVSRVTDHKHHWYDVVSGATLGITIASGCWKYYFSQTKPSPKLPQPAAV